MTSKPASRSVRAMTLAPRSCPSRPVLATTIRYRRFPARIIGRVPRTPQRRGRRAITGGVVAVAVALALVVGLAVLSSSGKVRTQLVDQDFFVGRTDRLAKAIRRDGPALIPSASPDKRADIYVQHAGGRDEE